MDGLDRTVPQRWHQTVPHHDLEEYRRCGGPWIVWGAVLSFVIIPVLVLFHGKRYCSWICGCGGLAETLGDRWRHLAPKGKASIRWEFMNGIVLAAAVLVDRANVAADL